MTCSDRIESFSSSGLSRRMNTLGREGGREGRRERSEGGREGGREGVRERVKKEGREGKVDGIVRYT